MKLKKVLWAGVLAVLVMVGAIGLPFHFATAQSAVGKAELVMITSPDYPPYEFYDTQGGDRKIVGFDIDIANTLAKELGFKLTIQESDFNGLIPALQAG